MSVAARESVILCEGYDDRSFLQGLLDASGWESCKGKAYAPLGNRTVKGDGQYAFRRGDRWARVVPWHGGTQWRKIADGFVVEARTSSIERLVVILDDDSFEIASNVDSLRQSFEDWATKSGASKLADGDWKTADLTLSLVVWQAADDAAVLPAKQTLERLVCAAIVEAYGARGPHVTDWLDRRPGKPAKEKLHKSHAASHMAGWYSEHGSHDFYREIWSDAGIASALSKRLEAIGAKRVLESL